MPDGPADEATFNCPGGLVVNPAGGVYLADSGNNLIRKISRDGKVSTVAGSIWMTPFGKSHIDGSRHDARFYGPSGLAVDARGRIYVADTFNHRIRRIELDSSLTTIAGSGAKGFKDGAPSSAEFNKPVDLAIGDDGTVYVVDSDNHCVRAIRP